MIGVPVCVQYIAYPKLILPYKMKKAYRVKRVNHHTFRSFIAFKRVNRMLTQSESEALPFLNFAFSATLRLCVNLPKPSCLLSSSGGS